jgi:hypothetical protein
MRRRYLVRVQPLYRRARLISYDLRVTTTDTVEASREQITHLGILRPVLLVYTLHLEHMGGGPYATHAYFLRWVT